MTFKNIQEKCSWAIGNRSSYSSEQQYYKNQIKYYINYVLGYINVWGGGCWDWLVDAYTHTIESPVDSHKGLTKDEIFVPHYVKYIYAVHNKSAKYKLLLKRKHEIITDHSDLSATYPDGRPMYLYEDRLVTTPLFNMGAATISGTTVTLTVAPYEELETLEGKSFRIAAEDKLYTIDQFVNVEPAYETGTVSINGTAATLSDAPAAGRGSFAAKYLVLHGNNTPYLISDHLAGSTSVTLNSAYVNPATFAATVTGATFYVVGGTTCSLTETYFNQSTYATTITSAAFEIGGQGNRIYKLLPAPSTSYDADEITIGYVRHMPALLNDNDVPSIPHDLMPAFINICAWVCQAVFDRQSPLTMAQVDQELGRLIMLNFSANRFMDVSQTKDRYYPNLDFYEKL